MRRTRWSGLLVVLMSSALLAVPAAATSTATATATATLPVTDPPEVRLAGPDRYETAAAISRASFTGPVGAALLASGEGFADALAGGPAAARLGAPLLLTRADLVPDAVWSELARLAPATVYLLGGPGAVAPTVAEALTSHGYAVVRLAGDNRYATAAAVASTWGAHAPTTVYLASGASFPDALSGGAAAAAQGAPVLLTGPTSLPPATRTTLKTLAPDRVAVLGGTAVISAALETEVRSLLPDRTVVVRYAGADRYATSSAIATAVWPTGASTVLYASGLGYADALAGVPAAAARHAPLLLTARTCLPSSVADATSTLAPALRVLLGGTGVLPDSAATTLCTRAGSASAALSTLAVKGRAPKTGYTRDQFGPAWSDVDHNGCDTRNDILRRDLTDIVTKVGTHGCVVASGTLDDPYTGTIIVFVRGPESIKVQIDHVVALSDAWQKGAQQWTPDTRKAFANDPLNLLAVDGPTNAGKGAGDAATWLTPNRSYRCTYVARQIAVKVKYHAWVTSAEKDAMSSVLSSCPDQVLPTSTGVPAPTDSPTG